MTGLFLDTSAYSALGRGHVAIASAVRVAERIVVNPVVLGELLAGFRRGKDRRGNEEQLDRFLRSPRVDVLVLDRRTSDCYAAIQASLREAGTPIPTNDMWIAATAMQHGLTVLTTDEDFLRVGQVLVDHHPTR